MKNRILPLLVSVLAFVLIAAGCSRKAQVDRELDKAVTAMDQATPGPATPPAPAPVSNAGSPASVQPSAPPEAAAETPKQQMTQAMAAYKSGELEDAVARLQRLRATPTLTPQQRMAVQDAVAAVMSEVYDMAAKGNTRAQAAIKEMNEARHGGH